MVYNWKMWFKAGEVLFTEENPSPFKIVSVTRDTVSIRFIGRRDRKTTTLNSTLLSKLARGRRMVARRETSLLDAIHEVWGGSGRGEVRDESQYWAVVCERARRLRRANHGDVVYREGGRVLHTLSRSERNPALRCACIKRYGVKCCICDFAFEKVYGLVGRGYIQVHHLDPMADVDVARDVRVDRLRPVCANCHVMLHQRTPPYTPKELRDMMKAASGS
jgi:predicted HNH restriction endonuclease